MRKRAPAVFSVGLRRRSIVFVPGASGGVTAGNQSDRKEGTQWFPFCQTVGPLLMITK